MWSKHQEALCAWARDSSWLVLIELDASGVVIACNAGCLAALDRRVDPIGERYAALFSTQPDDSGALPPLGRCVINPRPPVPPRRMETMILAAGDGRLVIAGDRQPDPEILRQLTSLNDEMTALTRALHKEKAQLARTLSRIRRLEGMLPICSYCHRIRDEGASWQRLESYLAEHSDAQFSHGICPTCLEARFGPGTDPPAPSTAPSTPPRHATPPPPRDR